MVLPIRMINVNIRVICVWKRKNKNEKNKFLAYLASVSTLVLVSGVVGCEMNEETELDIIETIDYEEGMTERELDIFVERMMELDELYYDKSENKTNSSNNFDSEQSEYINNICGYVDAKIPEAEEIYKERLMSNDNGQQSLQEEFYRSLGFSTDGEVNSIVHVDDYVVESCRDRSNENFNNFGITGFYVTDTFSEDKCSGYLDVDGSVKFSTFDEKRYGGIYGDKFNYTTSENLEIVTYDDEFRKVMSGVFGDVEYNDLKNNCSGLTVESFNKLNDPNLSLEVVGSRGDIAGFVDGISNYAFHEGIFDRKYVESQYAVVHNGNYVINIAKNMIEKALKMVKVNCGYIDSKIYQNESNGVWEIYVNDTPAGILEDNDAIMLLNRVGELENYLKKISNNWAEITVSSLKKYLIDFEKTN